MPSKWLGNTKENAMTDINNLPVIGTELFNAAYGSIIEVSD